MKPNPLLQKLGLPKDARAVIIHADDIGMCQATVSGLVELFEFGLVSSAAAMVPCAWFPAVAQVCRGNPDLDMGIHLTLTSEWSTYRWGPLSTRDPASGLLDAEGYFHHRQPAVQAEADPAAVQREIAAQVETAQQAGIDPTHIDTHMMTLAHPKFIGSYLGLALERRIPPMLVRMEAAGYRAQGPDAETAELFAGMVEQLEEQGLPLVDAVVSLPLNKPQDRIEQAKQALASAPAGITHLIIHPAQDTPELRAITSGWESRVEDFRTFTDEGLRRWVEAEGLVRLGYREIGAVAFGQA